MLFSSTNDSLTISGQLVNLLTGYASVLVVLFGLLQESVKGLRVQHRRVVQMGSVDRDVNTEESEN